MTKYELLNQEIKTVIAKNSVNKTNLNTIDRPSSYSITTYNKVINRLEIELTRAFDYEVEELENKLNIAVTSRDIAKHNKKIMNDIMRG